MKMQIECRDQSFHLTSAVLFYENKTERQVYASVHDVDSTDARPVIKPGRPLTEDAYIELVRRLSPEAKPQVEWIDRRVLAKGMGRLIWWEPAMKRNMFFKESPMIKGTFTGSGICAVPGMVFMAMDHSLYVWSFKATDMPTKDTPLHQAPLFNVWASGQVCSGNAVKPTDDGNPDQWERFFFESNFTHPNFRQKNRLMLNQDPVGYWKRQIKKPNASFNEEYLVDIGLKVSDLLAPDLRQRLSAIRAEGQF